MILFLFIRLFFSAIPWAYGYSQTRGGIGAAAACLHHSHSYARSKSCLSYTTAHGKAGSLTQWGRPGIEPSSSWILVGFVTHWDTMVTLLFFILYGRTPYIFLVLGSIKNISPAWQELTAAVLSCSKLLVWEEANAVWKKELSWECKGDSKDLFNSDGWLIINSFLHY